VTHLDGNDADESSWENFATENNSKNEINCANCSQRLFMILKIPVVQALIAHFIGVIGKAIVRRFSKVFLP
jgi:DNA-directed RNA polymerase subunit RPC12/RpoP